MSIKYILFDLDGTLLQTTADLAMALNCMRQSFNLSPLSEEKVAKLLGNGIRKLIAQSFYENDDLEVTEELLDRAVKINLDYYNEHIADLTTPYPGVIETLDELKKRQIKMAVVTNKHASAAKKILELTGMTSYFDVVMGDGENIPLKPAADLLLTALKRMNGDVAETLMVGDNWTDLESAANGNIKSVFVTYGYGTAGQAQADYTINNFADLKALIL